MVMVKVKRMWSVMIPAGFIDVGGGPGGKTEMVVVQWYDTTSMYTILARIEAARFISQKLIEILLLSLN